MRTVTFMRYAGEVQSVTSVGEGQSAEQKRRVRKYVVAMSIRTACVLAVVLLPGWWKWVAIVGAVVLPYLAVIVANEPRSKPVTPVQGPAPALEAGR